MSIEELHKIFLKHRSISTDSRNIFPGSIYFALKGENFDGNAFADEALKKGASYTVVDNSKASSSEKCILVENVLETLQQLALHHRKAYSIPVIAITGSNGKTTTKELTAAILSKKFNVLHSKGNFNNHIGLPLTLLDLNDHHQIAVLEMGANHQGEIDALCNIALPSFGLITNIGKAHLEGFGGYEGVVSAKTELYRHIQQQMGKVFVNFDDELLMHYAEPLARTTYGLTADADYTCQIINKFPFLNLLVSEKCAGFEISTQLSGTYNALNILASICIGRYFGVSVPDIKQAVKSYIPQNNRSQVVKTGKNNIFLDAYNANPTSVRAALDHFRELPGKTKICILGDMLELGKHSSAEHKAIIDLVLDANFDKAIFVGANFSNHQFKHSSCLFFADNAQAKAWLAKQNFNGYSVLLKGSRKIELEKLIDVL